MTPESSDSPSKAAPRDDSHRIKIHNWQDAVNPITDDTQLIRYMKLSAFLLLLDNRLFIPNLKLLQAQDRRESRIPQETGQEASFHIDHVVPVVAGGQSTSENLALACVSANRLLWKLWNTGDSRRSAMHAAVLYGG